MDDLWEISKEAILQESVPPLSWQYQEDPGELAALHLAFVATLHFS